MKFNFLFCWLSENDKDIAIARMSNWLELRYNDNFIVKLQTKA